MRKLLTSLMIACMAVIAPVAAAKRTVAASTPLAATKAVDKIGVALGTPDTTGALGNRAKLIAALRYLGVKMVRTRAPVLGTDSYRRIHVPLAKAGFRFVFVHAPGRELASEVAAMQALALIAPGCIIGYEGPNEPDLNPVTFGGFTDKRLGTRTGAGKGAMALQTAQVTALRKVWPANQVAMIAFNDWMHPQQYSVADYANSHIYPSGTTLAPRMAAFHKLVTSMGRPQGVISEWGYHNAVGSRVTAAGVSQAQAAKNYAADITLLVKDRSVKWAFAYTLVDYPGNKEFNRFGLFNSDWTPKPAAMAFRAALTAR